MYLESAAFNPSLGPLQSALATAVRARLESYDQVCVTLLLFAGASPHERWRSLKIKRRHVEHAKGSTVHMTSSS